jgi:hypothetical protein
MYRQPSSRSLARSRGVAIRCGGVAACSGGAAVRGSGVPVCSGRTAVRTGRGSRPPIAPSGTATTAPTASPAADSTDTSIGRACSTRIAIKANASNATHVPNVLIAYAAQSHPNGRPSDRIANIPSTSLAVSRKQPDVDQQAYSELQGRESNNWPCSRLLSAAGRAR